MNKFRRLGFIEYNGRLEIHNSLLNMGLHDKPEIGTNGSGARPEICAGPPFLRARPRARLNSHLTLSGTIRWWRRCDSGVLDSIFEWADRAWPVPIRLDGVLHRPVLPRIAWRRLHGIAV